MMEITSHHSMIILELEVSSSEEECTISKQDTFVTPLSPCLLILEHELNSSGRVGCTYILYI